MIVLIWALAPVSVFAGYGIRWWQDRGDYEEGYQEGRLRGHDLCEAEREDPDLWGVDDEATAAWIEGLAEPSPVLERARELLGAL